MSPQKEYLIFLDESDRKGDYFSNFYGGVIVGGAEYERVTRTLNEKKSELHFMAEVKWTKVSEPYLDRYIELVRAFFAELRAGHLRVRIMFRQNAHRPQNLTREQIEEEYFRLYYQFVKHSFGLKVMPDHGHPVSIRLYFDDLPDKVEKRERFKNFVLGLGSNPEIAARDILLTKDNITEVNSKNHVLLQCLDVVLGAMSFRLNDKHLEKVPETARRGKKTIAKEKLYKAIYAEIAALRPNFNIGISTGLGEAGEQWSGLYRHWNFKPRNSEWDSSLAKP